MGGKIEHRRGHGTHLDHVAAGGHHAPGKRVGQIRAGMAAIVPDAQAANPAREGLRTDGPANHLNNVRGQGFTHNPPDVIGPEDIPGQFHLGQSHFVNLRGATGAKDGIVATAKAQDIFIAVQHVDIGHVLALKKRLLGVVGGASAGFAGTGRLRLRPLAGFRNPLLDHLGQPVQHLAGRRDHVPAEGRQFGPFAAKHLVGPLNQRRHILAQPFLGTAKQNPDSHRSNQNRDTDKQRDHHNINRGDRYSGRRIGDCPGRVKERSGFGITGSAAPAGHSPGGSLDGLDQRELATKAGIDHLQ